MARRGEAEEKLSGPPSLGQYNCSKDLNTLDLIVSFSVLLFILEFFSMIVPGGYAQSGHLLLSPHPSRLHFDGANPECLTRWLPVCE